MPLLRGGRSAYAGWVNSSDSGRYPSRSPRPGGPPRPTRFHAQPFRPPAPPKLAPVGSESWNQPWVQMRTFSYQPSIYPAMMGDISPQAKSGDLVHVYDKNGRPFGAGLYNEYSRVPLRVIHHGEEPVDESIFERLVDCALDLRLNLLELPTAADAFRVIHSDADGLSGLIVDKFAEVLSVQVHSLGIWRRLPTLLSRLHARLGTTKTLLDVDPGVARNEGIRVEEHKSDRVASTKIREHGIRYEVNFETGHKTGFFCDQRENRRRLGQWVRGKSVLDLCCYSGGFAITAKQLGGATEVTGVDLDEAAIAAARRNANLNQARVEWVHCDAYAYARQMRKDGKRFGVVVLDPPKLIEGREEEDHAEGIAKYEDLNSLGIVITEPAGLLVTCSCSGQLSAEDFERLVIRSAHRVGRKLQFLDRTGAGADHPVMSNCPESRYLKVLWARVF